MKILTKTPLSSLVASAVLLSIVFAYLTPTSVSADVGVQPILPGGSNIEPGDGTPIEMAAETVEMTVREATEADNALITLNPEAYGLQSSNVWFTAIAEVQADFTMHNPTSDLISMTAWFPLASALEKISWELNPDEIVPRIESFKVGLNGNLIDYTVSELPNPKGADKPLLPWASFDLTFPAEQDTNIRVSYLLPLVPSIKGRELALYYIFQTGAGWAGSIGQAELIVNLPYPASAETIADIPANSFDLPYIMASIPTGLPAGVIAEGNQARWEWKDFEPGAQDDFSIWLLDPSDWEKLTVARSAVQANPEDGQAWLTLASIYYSLATVGYNSPSAFSNTYQPLGIEAYQKAAGLLPDHPAPIAGLALLKLSPYLRTSNAPPEVIQAAQDELTICQELESVSPYPEVVNVSCAFVQEALSIYSPNATATANWIASSTLAAQETLNAPIVQMPTTTPTLENTATSTPAPTDTDLPQPIATPTPVQSADSGSNFLILMAAGIVAIIILGYFLSKRMRGAGG